MVSDTSRLNRVCMVCTEYIDGIVHSCNFPVKKNDRLEVSGHEKCLREIIGGWDKKERSMEETKSILGLEVE